MNKVFKDNPSLNEFYQTTDGRPFYGENAAKNHAKTLGEGKGKVAHIVREVEVEASEEDENPSPAEYDMSMTRPQLDAVAKGFEINTDELGTKQDVIDAIDAFINGVTSKDLEDPKDSTESVDASAKTETEEKDTSDKGAEAVETKKTK
ncbi:hypothetical protein [Brumimicrobium mesophilum]|uniref:hypothetical protein n=1 Tax=Brumimicrobium mesophilum TaxID=392717 RepID=UPI000D140DE7|nr:hypothetical protein [Brumimicrobium mesophilum]